MLRFLVIAASRSWTFDLPPDCVIEVGRANDAQLRIDESVVSRHHARISTFGAEVRIVDLGSHNGTRVNGVRISSLRALWPGDVVTIGSTAIRLIG
jgi:pSer/pThr/pTyr-binding forkhead associated (FHA) protein